MSLLMDLLKKVGEKERRASVPPSVKPPFKRERGKHGIKLFLLVVLMGLFSVVAYIATLYFVGGRLDEKRLEEEILAIKERVEKSEVPRKEPEVQVQEAVAEEEEEPSVLDGGVEEPVQNPKKSEVKKEEKEEVVSEEEIPEKEKLQAKMSNVNPELEINKVVRDVIPQRNSARSGSFIPEYANSLYYGDYYFRKGDLKRSMEFYERAYSIRREQSVANNLITIYLRLGLRAKAKNLLNQHPAEKLYYTYIMELAKNFGTDEALREIGSMMAFDRRGYLYFARGYLKERLGDPEGASKDYRTAYKKDPSNPYFAFNYARMLEKKGKLREAYRIYQSLNLQSLEPKIKDIVSSRLRELRSLGIGR